MKDASVRHVHVRSGSDIDTQLYVKKLELERDFWGDAHRRLRDQVADVVNGVRDKGIVFLHIDGLKIKLVSGEE